MKLAMLLLAFASLCCAQESTVNVSSEGKQKWSPSEVSTAYLSACTAMQREFGDSLVLRPAIALVDHQVTAGQRVTVLTLSRERVSQVGLLKAK